MSRADPSPGVTWLMNDPISQFDLGMYRAAVTMQEVSAYFTESFPEDVLPIGVLYQSGSADYDFARNRIVLGSLVEITRDRFHTPQMCNAVAAHVRETLFDSSGIDVSDKPSLAEKAQRVVRGWFAGHRGFSRGDRPVGLERELVGITEISVTMHFPDAQNISCAHPLERAVP